MSKRNTFGIGIYQPSKEINIGTLTRSAFIMGADFVFFIGDHKKIDHRSDTTKSYRHLPFLIFDSFGEAQRVLTQYDFVAIEQGGTPLHKYWHPARAAYLLGNEVAGVPADVMEGCSSVVQVKTPRPYSLNVAQTGGIVMYDRLAKFSH